MSFNTRRRLKVVEGIELFFSTFTNIEILSFVLFLNVFSIILTIIIIAYISWHEKWWQLLFLISTMSADNSNTNRTLKKL